MRFFLDQNVDARLCTLLRGRGHDCWTADDSNLSAEADGNLTVYAIDMKAALITHDKEFSTSRKKRIIGQHLRVRCSAINVPSVVERHIDLVAEMFGRYQDLFIEISAEKLRNAPPERELVTNWTHVALRPNDVREVQVLVDGTWWTGDLEGLPPGAARLGRLCPPFHRTRVDVRRVASAGATSLVTLSRVSRRPGCGTPMRSSS